MNAILITLSIVVFIVGLAGLLSYSVSSSVHKSMTTDNCKEWGYATFDQFMEQFNKTNWQEVPTSRWPNSFFDYESDSKVHAGIIRFKGKGMVLRRFDYAKLHLFLESVKKQNSGPKEGLWK